MRNTWGKRQRDEYRTTAMSSSPCTILLFDAYTQRQGEIFRAQTTKKIGKIVLLQCLDVRHTFIVYLNRSYNLASFCSFTLFEMQRPKDWWLTKQIRVVPFIVLMQKLRCCCCLERDFKQKNVECSEKPLNILTRRQQTVSTKLQPMKLTTKKLLSERLTGKYQFEAPHRSTRTKKLTSNTIYKAIR